MTDNNVCKAHSGLTTKIEKLEDNVHELWKKWDSMQKLMLGSLITLVLNLIGIAFLFATRPDSIPKP